MFPADLIGIGDTVVINRPGGGERITTEVEWLNEHGVWFKDPVEQRIRCLGWPLVDLTVVKRRDG